tara:strand:+ start:217 stop:819 length:603 start_codon:yes stop_codon:yes gene_type:complete
MFIFLKNYHNLKVMIKQNLAIYSIPTLFNILKELENELNINVSLISNKQELDKLSFSEYLIITDKKNLNFINLLEVNFPLKIKVLIEKINIKLIKIKTKEQAEILIGNYVLNQNARTLELKSKLINLTEKEVNLILFLHTSEKPVNVEKLQLDVWGYKGQLETHTVETHIHRLRKKILDMFKINNFIVSDKQGYYLNKLL